MSNASKSRSATCQEKHSLLAGILCCMGLVGCETCFAFNIRTAPSSTGTSMTLESRDTDSHPHGGSYALLSEM
jgi:hypothetical protein